MTRRVKQHQLEDISRSKYSLAIPRNWVMRDKAKDYGIDAEIEIFDENTQATGLVYWVQLKATETSKESAAKKLDLDVDSLRYYKSLELPVLIVRYSEKTDKFYCKWAHEIDLFYAKKNATTIRISFCDEDVWCSDSSIKTIKYLKRTRAIKAGAITLPVPVFMDVKNNSINGMARGAFMSVFRQALQDYPQIATYQSDPEKAVLGVSLNDNELVISLSAITGCTFHSIRDREKAAFTEGIVADVMLGLAVAMEQLGQIEIAATICLHNKLKTRFLQNEEMFSRFIPMLIRSSRYGEAIDAVCEAIGSNYDNNILENITLASAITVASKDENRYISIEKLLDKCLDKSITFGENALIGIAHYNLANHYHNRSLHKKSIFHYLKARRFEPKYLNQPYYYSELGGSLFELGKYRFSARSYKLALDKGASASVKPNYADALMLGGNYKLALDVFFEYLHSTKDTHAQWQLQHKCLEMLIAQTGVKTQVRRKKEAICGVDFSKAGTPSFITDLEKAIELDNLCGLAWFNLGIANSKSGNHKEAAISFTICGLVQRGDKEAWVNATLCSLNKEVDPYFAILVVHTSYFFNGDDYLTIFYEELAKRFQGDVLEAFTNAFEKLLPKNRGENKAPEFRRLHDDGIFRNMFTEKDN